MRGSRNEKNIKNLVTKVAVLYYEKSISQTDIAKQLGISQATVSRLLKLAQDLGIVRIVVKKPIENYFYLEEKLKEKYNLKDVVVTRGFLGNESQTIQNIAQAAAFFLETEIKNDDVIGIACWSEVLYHTINFMTPFNNVSNCEVIQILGGIGDPSAEIHAFQLTKRLAQILNGKMLLLPAPALVSSTDAKKILLNDPSIKETISKFEELTLVITGIGSLQPSQLLQKSGNIFKEEELSLLKRKGAIGEICLHFFDKEGKPIEGELNERVIGIDIKQLKKVERVIGIAGGERKHKAI
ncbi:MAG: sugar-binding transcriptional regulator, partial [Dictyoglomaceae bacterium]|nr:sugar-binding transcriptional regulator [Dictyoglomaceae bacterium]